MHSRAHIIISIFMGRHNLILVPEVQSTFAEGCPKQCSNKRGTHPIPYEDEVFRRQKERAAFTAKKFHLHYCNDVGECRGITRIHRSPITIKAEAIRKADSRSN